MTQLDDRPPAAKGHPGRPAAAGGSVHRRRPRGTPRTARRWRRLGAAGAVVVVVGALAAAIQADPAGPGPPYVPGGHTGTGAASAQGTALDPSMFEPGACTAFSPTRGDLHRTVFIDPGHGGVDTGALGITQSGQQIHEADETLPVALDAMTLLRADGYRVVVSRTRDTTVLRPGPGDLTPTEGVFTLQGEHDDVAARDVCANLAHATVLLGIYFDAGTSSTDAGSITGYDADRPFSADNLKLADLLQRDVLARLNAHGWGIPNDRVVTDRTLGGPAQTTAAAAYDHLLLLGPADPGWFTTPSTMPGALIEPLFITDPFEGTIAASPAGQQAIAQGMAQAAEQYFGTSRTAR